MKAIQHLAGGGGGGGEGGGEGEKGGSSSVQGQTLITYVYGWMDPALAYTIHAHTTAMHACTQTHTFILSNHTEWSYTRFPLRFLGT